MAQDKTSSGASMQATSVAAACRKVTEELTRRRSAVQSVVPRDTLISFHFDDRLHVDIDVRSLEDLASAETLLPSLFDGIFSNLRRSLADRHSFRHRLTAEVETGR